MGTLNRNRGIDEKESRFTTLNRNVTEGTDKKGSRFTALNQFEGKWLRHQDHMPMGQILNGQVVWDANYSHKPSPLKLLPNGNLEMELEQGELYEGHFED